MKIREMTWKQFKNMGDKVKTVIIPTGAIEVYGPHLPLGTDTIVAEEIAKIVGDKLGLVVGPSLEVGESMALYDFPGTLTIKPEHFKNYLEDVCLSFIKWGSKNFIFMNTHLGNVPIINQLSWKLQDDYGAKCCQIDWWRYVQPFCEGVTKYSGVMAHGHASEAGTSIMLYLKPELVHLSEIVCTPSQYQDDYPEMIKYVELRKYTDTGTIGDATVATAEKGKILVEKCVERIIAYVKFAYGI